MSRLNSLIFNPRHVSTRQKSKQETVYPELNLLFYEFLPILDASSRKAYNYALTLRVPLSWLYP